MANNVVHLPTDVNVTIKTDHRTGGFLIKVYGEDVINWQQAYAALETVLPEHTHTPGTLLDSYEVEI